MDWSVKLRPASRKLPSLGVYRSMISLNGLNRLSDAINYPIDAIYSLINVVNDQNDDFNEQISAIT